jgi:hypothetical protein
MVRVLGIVVGAWSSIITHRGGDSFGSGGCAGDVSCVIREISDAL